MGYSPENLDGYDLASVIEGLGGDLPVTTEASDALLEAILGTYVVRGDLCGDVPVTNVRLGTFLHENLQQALDDSTFGDAAVCAYLVSSAGARVLGEYVFARALLDSGIAPGESIVDCAAVHRLVEDGRFVLPSGPASDDVMVLKEGVPHTILEIKLSQGGFVYALRSASKAHAQLVATLKANPELPEAALIAIALQGHNAMVLWRPRDWWLRSTGKDVRQTLRRIYRSSVWPGESSQI